jgi:hypothetical protein
MTWSISISAADKATAKLRATEALGKQMLAQSPHARDFPVVLAAVHGAVDACAEGQVTISGSGHLNGDWKDGDIPEVRGVVLRLEVSSRPA